MNNQTTSVLLAISAILLSLVIQSCAYDGVTHELTKTYKEIPLGDCIEMSERVGFNYEKLVKKAASNEIQSMTTLMEISKIARFDGAASTTHREVLWDLYKNNPKTFLLSYSTLDPSLQTSVANNLQYMGGR